MKVLVVHNRYQQAGGEDAVVRDELALLRGAGVEVDCYERDNADIAAMPRPAAAVQSFWSRRTLSELGERLRAFRPDVMHVHNTVALVSPSAYQAATAAGVPVVQTLHNFRWICPQGLLLREGRACEDCVGRLPWRGVVHRCYRESALQSAVMGTTVAFHRSVGGLHRKVQRYIALNDFSRQLFVRAGFPADRVVVKPNFVAPPAAATGAAPAARFLYVGRLSHEKGCEVLAQACRLAPQLRLDVVGAGPLEGLFTGLPNVRLHGWRSAPEIAALMHGSLALVLPSICYENFPRTLVEALSCGLPVIGSRLGAMQVLIDEQRTGALFEPGNAAALVEQMQRLAADPAGRARMAQECLRTYEAHYRPETNLALLLQIYADARRERGLEPA